METNQFFIESPAFKDGADIPEEFTAKGENVSPPLEWSKIPMHAKSFALICEDPDAPSGPYIHWVIYKIPKSIVNLDKGIMQKNILSIGAVQGLNSSGTIGYIGPNPPEKTGTHRYYFRLFALDEELNLDEGLSKDELMDAIRDHILSEAELVGRSAYH